MKKNRSLYLVLMALIICLCLAFTACGKNSSDDDDDDIVYDNGDDNYRDDNSGDNGNNSGNYFDGDQGNYSDNNSDNNGQGDNYDPYFVGGYDVTIYHAGDDTIAVEMTGDSIYNNDDGYYFLEIDDTNGQMLGGINLNRYYSYVGKALVERDGDHTTVSLQEIEGLGGNEGTSTIFGEHKMLITMSKPGAWNEIPDFSNGVYELRRDADVLARGKISDILKTVTADEMNSKLVELQMTRVGQNPVKADWAGKYISGYNSPAAYLEVEVSKTDVIHFHMVMKDKVYDWFADESYFDKSEYDGTQYYSASCYIYDNNGNSVASVNYSGNDRYPDRASIDMSCYFDTGSFTIYFSQFTGAWHSRPDDFKDKDIMGLMSDSIFDDDCFNPATDDYLLQVWGGTSRSGLYAGSDLYDCYNQYSLISFDKNGYGIQYVEKYILKSDKEASEAYHKIVDGTDFTYSSVTYVLNGRNVYIVHDLKNNYNYAKIGRLDAVYGDDWYVNCHYVIPGDNSEAYYTYLYLSKPITEAEYSMSLEQMLYWKAMDWNMPCIDDPNYYLRAEVNELRTRFSVERENYTDEEPRMRGTEDNYLRFHGDTAEGIYVNFYEYSNEGTVLIHEYAFGAEEITVTEYQYNFTDPDSLDITLDNYKTKTADAVITHTFAVKEQEVSQW